MYKANISIVVYQIEIDDRSRAAISALARVAVADWAHRSTTGPSVPRTAFHRPSANSEDNQLRVVPVPTVTPPLLKMATGLDTRYPTGI